MIGLPKLPICFKEEIEIEFPFYWEHPSYLGNTKFKVSKVKDIDGPMYTLIINKMFTDRVTISIYKESSSLPQYYFGIKKDDFKKDAQIKAQETWDNAWEILLKDII